MNTEKCCIANKTKQNIKIVKNNKNSSVTLHLVGVGVDWAEGATRREFFFCPKRFLWEQKNKKQLDVCFEFKTWSLSKTEHQWEDLLCRWRRWLVMGKPALLARNLKSFKGIFSHPVGFCFHKNIVRIGGLHDGVMLHHTVDAWRRPQKRSNNHRLNV